MVVGLVCLALDGDAPGAAVVGQQPDAAVREQRERELALVQHLRRHVADPGDGLSLAADRRDLLRMRAGAIVRELPIINKRGLHARASAKFVQTAEKFDAEMTVTRNGETVGGTSIMGLMMLAAGIGTSITVSAKGREAQAAIDAITELVASKFGEE